MYSVEGILNDEDNIKFALFSPLKIRLWIIFSVLSVHQHYLYNMTFDQMMR